MNNPDTIRHLALYHFQACPFCAVTRGALNFLDIAVERRDILNEPKYREELIQQGGKSQVPCLRIENHDGTVEWLYESRDIVRFVRDYASEIQAAA